MTAVTAGIGLPVRREPRTRGLLWATWRQHRVALLGIVAVLGALAVLLLITGRSMHSAYRTDGVAACIQSSSDTCQPGLDLFRSHWDRLVQTLPHLLLFAPLFIGGFVGAPLVAREIESGTFRFAWTQGVSRRRWLSVKVLALASAVTAVGFAFSALYSWWFSPVQPLFGRMDTGSAYELEGVVFATRTLLAFAMGVLIGALTRRVVASMAATGALWFIVAFFSTTVLRKHIEAPIVAQQGTATANDGSAWVLSSWIQNASGRHLSDSEVAAIIGPPTGPAVQSGGHVKAVFGGPDPLAQHGLSAWVSLQPGSRFWHFQLIEGSAYAAVAVALIAAALAIVPRRT